MGGSRRRGKRRGLRAERQAQQRAREQGDEVAVRPARARRSLRQTIDSFGGLVTIGVVGLAVVIVGVLFYSNFVTNSPAGSSDGPLMGEPRTNPGATHIATTAEMNIVAGEPPTGGPHFSVPQRQGVYDEPVEDGNAVHSLEHGLVWISYNAALVSAEDIAELEAVADDFRRDVFLSPRPENEMPIAATSWERILRLDEVDGELLREFVRANRNRSPEPGVR